MRRRDEVARLKLGAVLPMALCLMTLSLQAPAHAQEQGNRLNLVCDGGGAANRTTSTVAHGWDNNGNSASAVVTGRRSVGFEDQLQLWIEGGQGKARLPRVMLPTLHGGDGGWFEIKDIRISDNEITGSVSVNVINHPKLVLDRMAGTVSLSGKAGQFNGRCRKFDPATAERAF